MKRDITLVLAYYENAGMLAEQFEVVAAYPDAVKAHLRIIVVDDGSPTAPAGALALRKIDVPVKLYRMLEDIRWNQDACRNLAVSEAETDWVLLTDMDHVVPSDTFEKVMKAGLQSDTAYRFARVSMPKLDPYKMHPNSWLMTKTVFDLVGGYDERFRGWYGTDGDFKARLGFVAPIVQLKEVLIRYPREVIQDASTTTLTRKSDEDGEAIKRIKYERSRETDGRPKRGLTPWKRIH